MQLVRVRLQLHRCLSMQCVFACVCTCHASSPAPSIASRSTRNTFWCPCRLRCSLRDPCMPLPTGIHHANCCCRYVLCACIASVCDSHSCLLLPHSRGQCDALPCAGAAVWQARGDWHRGAPDLHHFNFIPARSIVFHSMALHRSKGRVCK